MDTTSTGDVSLEGCTKLTELSVKFSQALGAATTGSGGPDLQATAKAYEDFADEVPEEIRGAFRTIAAAFGTYADVLGDIDMSSGKAPDAKTMQKLAEAAQKLDNTKLTAASAADRGVGEEELQRGRVATPACRGTAWPRPRSGHDLQLLGSGNVSWVL